MDPVSSNYFGWKLFLMEREENSEGNVLFSPLAIATSLSTLFLRMKGNTNKQTEEILIVKCDELTNEELRKLLIFLCSSTENTILNIVDLINVTGTKYDIFSKFPDYLTLNCTEENTDSHFQLKTEKVQEQSSLILKTATRRTINELISESFVEKHVKLIFVNAIYFVGNWSEPFSNVITLYKPFYTINNEKIMVDMMLKRNEYKYFNMKDLKVSFLEIPYSENSFSMVIILPEERNGLRNIEFSISLEDINRGIENMKENSISLYFPKFKLDQSLSLKDHLVHFGIEDPLVAYLNLLGIMEESNIKLFDVIHKTFFEVNEGGTEVSSPTTVLRAVPTWLRPSFDFVVDHPFMFIIRDIQKGYILFIGSVYKL